MANRGTHWRNGADLVVEVVSPGDRTYEKIAFYSQVGVRELLVIDRKPWELKLYRRGEGGLELLDTSDPRRRQWVSSQIVPLRFRLVPGGERPQIEVEHRDSPQHWTI